MTGAIGERHVPFGTTPLKGSRPSQPFVEEIGLPTVGTGEWSPGNGGVVLIDITAPAVEVT